MKDTFYITTTLAYINSDPHVGFAAELIKADVIARYQRQLGKEVFFNTGTDEHGLKIYRKAQETGVDVQSYCDEYAAKFDNLKSTLNLSYNKFIRTTDANHIAAAQEFWKRCDANGDIYKKNYSIKYCVGCELEKTESELVDGKCSLHPNQEIELIEEENYFFRFSKYQDKILALYKNNPEFTVPAHRLNEIRNFVASGLQDFSISRLAKKMPWGILVPGDSEHVMYVWFDALINYVSTLGWPDDKATFKKFWPVVQVAGKDNLRQQSAMWQAMLLSAGLPSSKQVLIFGFLTADGEKMSKSLGNVINPYEVVEKYGADATRYYLLAEIQTFEDGDFSYKKFDIRYNADLANGLGNLVARVSNLLEKNELEVNIKVNSDEKLVKEFRQKMDKYEFNNALELLWRKLKEADEILSAKAPWKMKNKNDIEKVLKPVAQNILNVAYCLQPFMPETAEKIMKQFSEKQIRKGDILFPRIVA